MLTLDRTGTIEIKQYWDALPTQDQSAMTERAAKSTREILRLLRDSIRKRMMADVPFGVFLSGGVDSSANVALMAELMSQPVRTFTVGFKDNQDLNELDSARAIAKRFATDHHEVIIDREDMEKFLPDLVFHQDEPLADPVCVPLYYVSRLARETGTIVVQTGEGADEIFAGYDWFGKYNRINDRFWRHAEKLPGSMRRTGAALAGPVMEKAFNKRTAARSCGVWVRAKRSFGAGRSFSMRAQARVFSPAFNARANGQSSYSVVSEYLDHVAGSGRNLTLPRVCLISNSNFDCPSCC